MGVGFDSTLMSHGKKISDFGHHSINTPKIRPSRVVMDGVHIPQVKVHGLATANYKSIKSGNMDFGRGIDVQAHLNRAWTTLRNI